MIQQLAEVASGIVVVGGARSLLTVVLGVSSLLDRQARRGDDDAARPGGVISGLLAAVAVLVVDAAYWARGTSRSTWATGWQSSRRTTTSRSSSSSIGSRCRWPSCRSCCRARSGRLPAATCTASAGFNRFFVLYALFLLGMVVASLAGTIETLFTGWELVGLSSALLVAFFQERPAPSRNGAVGLVRLPGLGRGAAAGRRGHAPPARRGRLRRLLGLGTLARGAGACDLDARPSSSACCSWSRRPASRPWCPSPAGCRGPWKGRRRPAPCSTGPCRCTWALSCCCGSARSSSGRCCWSHWSSRWG